MCFMQFTDILASSKRSGSSLESFSRATSAIGPNITTGLRKPAAQGKRNRLQTYKTVLLLLNGLTDMSRHLTLSQHNSFISWELCLDWL